MCAFILLVPSPMYGMSPDAKLFLLGRIGMDRLPKMFGIIQEKVALEGSWLFSVWISILCDRVLARLKSWFSYAVPFGVSF